MADSTPTAAPVTAARPTAPARHPGTSGPERTSLAGLDILLAIDEHGSLSEAARTLGLAQPTVSSAVRRLERRLGLALVDRSTRGSTLTDSGRTVAGWARAVVEASNRFESSVAALREGAAARITVAASLTIAEYLAPRWLAALPSPAAPRSVALTVDNSERVMELVLTGAADLGFVEGPRVRRGLRQRTIGHDTLVVVVAADHRWARRRSAVSVEELVTSRLVLRERGSGTREILERAVERAGHSVPFGLPELGSTAAVKAAVSAGTAVGVLSRYAVAAELAAGTLRAVDAGDLDLRRRLRMVWAGGRSLTGGAAELARLVVALEPEA